MSPHSRLTHVDALLSAVLCGLTLHLAFNRLEKTQLSALKRIVLVAPILPSYVLRLVYPTWTRALCVGYSICYATLLSSVVLYRLSPFHPLAKYPGPFLAKCTKFWGVYHSHTGKTHINFLNIHRRYGPVVRTGPNELSFCDVDVIQPILGMDGMGKGPIWDGRRSPKSKHWALIGIRSTAEHLHRRKPWNRAFNTSGVKAYEPILTKRVLQMVDSLTTDASAKRFVDLADRISCFSYDFMGDMAFGGGFELMSEGDKDGLWKIMERGVRVQAYTQHVPWFSPLLYGLPGMGKAAQKLINFVLTQSDRRVKRGASEQQDLSSFLLDEGSPDPKPLEFGDYFSDAFLAVIAGSDTAATVMTATFFHLLSDKTIFNRLRAEIDGSFPPSGARTPSDDIAALANLPFLNAVIKEALRLQPPVPTGLQRAPERGTGGKVVGSVFVPEDTGVYVAPYVIHRDPRYFSPEPERFWPERWLKEGFVSNEAAFIPFSAGPMNCVGKALAQMELRLVVATLVQRFDMEFKTGWDPLEWERSLEDFFVFSKGPLPIVVKQRL